MSVACVGILRAVLPSCAGISRLVRPLRQLTCVSAVREHTGPAIVCRLRDSAELVNYNGTVIAISVLSGLRRRNTYLGYRTG